MEGETKGAIVDMDDTLYDYQHSNEEGTKAVLDYAEKKLNEDKFNDTETSGNKLEISDEQRNTVTKQQKFTRSEIMSAISLGRKQTNEAMPNQGSGHSRLLYFQKALEKLTGRTNFELTLEMEKIFWDAFVEHMDIYDGAIEFLKNLKQKNRKVTILTDLTAQIQHKKIIKLLGGNQHYVDYLVSSEEAGEEKPGPEGFRLSLEKMNLDKDEVCMVGDNYEKDIMGAKKFGIKKLYHKLNNNKWEGDQDDGVKHFKFFSEIQGDF